MSFLIGPLMLTGYVIERDHDDAPGLFCVDVPEAGHRGIGAQVRLGGYVVGGSAVLVGEPRPGEK